MTRRAPKIVLASLVASAAWCAADGATRDSPLFAAGSPGVLRLRDRGSEGAWTTGAPVTLRWSQQGLSGAEVSVQVSRDLGITWNEIGRAPAKDRRFTWVVDGEWGDALVRLEGLGKRVRSARRSVTFVAPVREFAWGAVFIAVHEDGVVRAWVEIPIGSGQWVDRPAVFPEISHVVSVAGASAAGVVLIKDDGSVWRWGLNDGSLPPFLVPTKLEGIEHAVWARSDWGRTFVRVEDGRVFGLSDSDGWSPLAGPDDSVIAGVPMEIPALRDVVDLGIGAIHGIALRPDGRVLAWGSNEYGRLGDDTPPQGRLEPGVVPVLEDIVAIETVFGASMALKRDGSVWMWGTDDYRPAEALPSPAPYRVAGLERIASIGCGDGFYLALRDDGVLSGWGSNVNGQLATDPYVGFTVTPVECVLRDVAKIFVSDGIIEAITKSGERFAWGGFVEDGKGRSSRWPVAIHSR